MSTRIIKDATGTALTTITAGAKNSRILSNFAESPAARIPAAAARKKPPRIRTREKPMERQNSVSMTSPVSLSKTTTGDTSRISCPIHTLTACHTKSQTATAQNRIVLFFFLFAVVELIFW